MFAYLNGTVAEKNANELILDVNGVGYSMVCSMNTLQSTPSVNEKAKVYTFLSVREDGIDLYGFSTYDEKKMFLKLTGVTGIGPKSAIGILSSMPLNDLMLAIVTEDASALSRAPGVGKKTAQRIILELKEALGKEDITNVTTASPVNMHYQQDSIKEALSALQALGYSASEAARAVSYVKDQSDQPDELVRLALRNMAGV